MACEIEFEWVHVSYDETSQFTETYGFSGSQGLVNLEGVLIRPVDRASRTLLVFMHPSSTLQLLPVPQEAARMGAHVLCAGTRYARNDTAAILEKVVLDLGAYIRHAKAVWGYEKVVIVGWSGGGSLALFYQSQAERPTITHTPAGDPVDIAGAGLIPADALVFQAAHISRARLLVDMIDPSVLDESKPDIRDRHLDIYDIANPNRPPYGAAFVERYRAAQLARVRRITATVKETMAMLKDKGGAEVERGFVTHRTLADPRFLDPTLDPNERKPGWCYLGNPETANSGPVGLARFSTLRAWLSQWSIDDSQADGLYCAASITAPMLVIENTADDGVPQPHPRMIFEAAFSHDKQFERAVDANHYYAGQPQQLRQATQLVQTWLRDRQLSC
ncbi:alpha/beta hydrolase [Sphingomonas sp. MG17]|uniref:Alpha/beta hydrolase n=1 Tax=Sphingomonas tagetis TaxID=2949092 RepID=A0A9X2HFQ3_9SPHN|nr:alpha/beta hydrolase [Sphingomonas tagetis]MCP3730291.1 alpha/beta hydrolase [Sphingomonas tagetis]